MPTVFSIGSRRFFFYSNEGFERAHVHVQRGSSFAKFWLQPVSVASSRGFRLHELRSIEKQVHENRDRLLHAWNEFFAI